MTCNETGLYYLLARYYEPKEGVFLAVDLSQVKQKDPISQHPYAYAQNNPVMLDDPDGEHSLVAVCCKKRDEVCCQKI
ncbi:RHS repeat-associated core domain-containing protein [Robertmurraya sp. DFI.2.37]|uniref:RHS repeat-associated core domain-containing protein n=1 Tax=Robertmurraya sp. DFI.2.37 TaxID=3031819 RepID=UPI001248F079|nr:RHS repeat-associated core domain-containing protein [Robertmurraya sp. DFI.2.37]MDF1508545.1 RHS repeat-associated core domain-containing protein [Robertmurraya sp. DFI.2.37]